MPVFSHSGTCTEAASLARFGCVGVRRRASGGFTAAAAFVADDLVGVGSGVKGAVGMLQSLLCKCKNPKSRPVGIIHGYLGYYPEPAV